MDEPDWDKLLDNQTKATKQAEQDLAKDKAHTEALKKIAEHGKQQPVKPTPKKDGWGMGR